MQKKSGRPLRSIPAYAGGTRKRILVNFSLRVDPRVCGGDIMRPECGLITEGRSPRMRGGHPAVGSAARDMRSIPAYAGGT